MKRTLILLFLAMVVILTACGKVPVPQEPDPAEYNDKNIEPSIELQSRSSLQQEGPEEPFVSPYTVWEVGPSDTVSFGKHQYEYEFRSNRDTIEGMKTEQKTIQWKSAQLIGLYSSTKTDVFDPGIRDTYITANSILFEVDRADGVVTSVYDSSDPETRSTKVYTKEQCLEIAKKFFKQLTDDPEAYTVVEWRITDWKNDLTFYKWKFVRMIGGIESADNAVIGILSNGEMKSFSINCFGKMSQYVLPSDFDQEVIQKSIDAKLNEIYGEETDRNLVFAPREDDLLFFMEDGTLALRKAVDVCQIFKDGDLERTIAYLTEFVIPLN